MKNSKAKIIAVANQKGGVAKTTSVINIGAGLALKGKKVLLVDTDNQSHLSRFLGYDGTDGKPTISELIFQTVSKVMKPVSEAIRKSELGVDYIPSNFMLAGIISILGTDSDSTGVFSRLFSDGTFDEYDYIIIDCPPTLDLSLSTVPRHLTCSFQMPLKLVTRCLSLFSLTFGLMRVSIRYSPHFKEQSRQVI